MEWNENNIQEAISKSKLTQSLFIVLTEDDNTSDGETWVNDKIKELVEENKCVLVRLKAHSTTAVQFNQIYPVSIYPTAYFIGNNGKPLEVKTGKSTAPELINSFNKALQLHKSSIGASDATSSKNEEPLRTSTQETSAIQPPSSSNIDDQELMGADQGDVNERAQKEKMKNEIEEARKVKNLEYQALRDKMREKEEEKRTNKEEITKGMQAKEIPKKKSAVIQFKLPDGSSVVKGFKPEDCLQVARLYVIEHLKGRVKSLKLSQLRPRVLIDDYDKTFVDYDLVPSAVLVVLFDVEAQTNQAASSNGLFALWAKFILILQYFLSWIIPSSPSQPSLSSPSPSNPPSSSTPNTSPLPSSTPQNNPAARPKTSSQKSGLRQRKEGNVHRLTADDEDDELATWNGNSTQQM